MLKDKIEKRKKMDKKKAAVIGLSIAVAAGGAAAGGVAYANEVELEETKDKAYATVQQIDLSKYDTAQANEIQQLIDNAKANIEKAESIDEVNGLVASFQDTINGVEVAKREEPKVEQEQAQESQANTNENYSSNDNYNGGSNEGYSSSNEQASKNNGSENESVNQTETRDDFSRYVNEAMRRTEEPGVREEHQRITDEATGWDIR